MAHQVAERIEADSGFFIEQQAEADRLGRLPDESAKRIRDSGVVRLLQRKDFGGYEADPRDFLSAVMDIGRYCPSSGWVAGVVGIHPWGLSLMDERLQDDIWGDDPDTWVASPYAPTGIAEPVDGGYVVNGRWNFSSGTDHCSWVVLGALVGDGEGKPAKPVTFLHIVVPRADYEIIDDSWNVMGLAGTGSKDVVIKGAFVPDYRTIDFEVISSPEAAARAGRSEPLYRLPWSAMFPNSVSAGLIGIAEGVLRCALEYQAGRVSITGAAQVSDTYSRTAIAEAASDIRSARIQILHNVGEMYDALQRGHSITIEQTVAARRDQVRVAWRAAAAADAVFSRCGGNAIRLDNPLQAFWRSMHAGLNHVIFVPGPTYDAAGGMLMGVEPEGRI